MEINAFWRYYFRMEPKESANQSSYPLVHLSDFEPIPEDVLAIFPVSLVRRSLVVPVARRGDRVIAVVPKTEGIVKPEGLRLVAGGPVDLAIAPTDEIIAFIKSHYPETKESSGPSSLYPSEAGPSEKTPPDEEIKGDEERPETEEMKEALPGHDGPVDIQEGMAEENEPEEKEEPEFIEVPDDQTPTPQETLIPDILRRLLEEAARYGAREILVEQKGENFRLRQRIKGVLLAQGPWHKWSPSEFLEIIHATRSLGTPYSESGIKWTEIRRQISIKNEKFNVLFKLSETLDLNVLSIHIQPGTEKLFSPADWGMDTAQTGLFESLLALDRGLILFCGLDQDNIGRTLRQCVRKQATADKHLIMVEVNLEEWIPDVDHYSAKGDEKLFGELLKINLRHLPDLLVVDPLVKKEDVELCMKFGLDGSKIFGRFFCQDSAESLARLISMGVDLHLIRYSIAGFVSQRTLKMNCPHCQIKDGVRRDQTKDIGIPVEMIPPFFYKGRGCDSCHQTGFDREVDIFEVVIMNDELKKQVTPDFRAEKFRSVIKSEGMSTLRHIALRKAIDGQTSLSEVVRATLK